jgi:hypothetical protein
MKRSSVKTFFSEKKAIYLPSGLIDGDMLILPPFSPVISSLPAISSASAVRY